MKHRVFVAFFLSLLWLAPTRSVEASTAGFPCPAGFTFQGIMVSPQGMVAVPDGADTSSLYPSYCTPNTAPGRENTEGERLDVLRTRGGGAEQALEDRPVRELPPRDIKEPRRVE